MSSDRPENPSAPDEQPQADLSSSGEAEGETASDPTPSATVAEQRFPLHWQILLAMVLGASIGFTLNATLSERETTAEINNLVYFFRDSTQRIEIRVEDQAGNFLDEWIVDPSGQTPGAYYDLGAFKKNQPKEYLRFHAHGRSTARRIGDAAHLIGALFLRLLKMVAIPLIICSLMTGVTGLANASRLGRMFGRTISYYLATSFLAIITGLFFVNTIQPGVKPQPVKAAEQKAADETPPPKELAALLYEQLENMIPENPIGAAAQGDFLSIIAFTLAFGIFTVIVGGQSADVIRNLFQAAFDVMMALTLAVIKLAPFGVFALMLYATSTQGLGLFLSLGWYFLTVLCALFVHGVIVLPLIVKWVAGRSPLQYANALSPALLTAFSSASSNATLPLTLSCVEKRAGISNRIGSFVLPLGATINMDGTALYEVVAVMFIAQLEPNFTLTLATQILIVVTALLASIGAAGIPSAGFVMMVIILQAVGLPADKVPIILAIDRVLDMCRTSVNVWSDACGCAVIERFEGK
ncbi:MAG: hypothetical protein KatS3mg105_1816 [Gemmatales bacterium]|nr:MAG: hypothetical protein KatS3mg105_1816 [Gemmatales bacterium]